MELLFREVRPDEVEQELTQRDQFNTDRVPLAATLVRESHQNSTDARPKNSASPVKIRIAYKASDPATAPFWRGWLIKVQEHLDASGLGLRNLDLGMPDFLVIEDFATTGLTGSVDRKDEDNFSDFWRRVGRSHKAGNKGGSWGLGKLVFPVASEIRTFFGLTIRDGDAAVQPLLMGQTVLTTHRINGTDFAPHGFFAVPGAKGFQLPVTDRALIARFSAAVGFTRRSEPGLSVAIPFPQDTLRPERLLPLIVEHYFFPILTGQLEVACGAHTITARTFDTVANPPDSPPLVDPSLIAFIREIDRAGSAAPQLTLPKSWAAQGLGQVVGEQELQSLRRIYDAGALVHVRAPILLRPRQGKPEDGTFDLFLRRAPDDAPGKALFIRGSVTLPNEEINFRNRKAFAALVAPDGPVSQFLRDAENPAHTSWNGNAEKLTRNWRAAADRLREIRHSLRQLHELVDQGIRREDPDALKALISLKDRAAAPRSREPSLVRPANVPELAPSPKLYTLTSRKGGFSLKAGPGLTANSLPLKINVRAAYDMPTGNPFKKFSRYDFDFRAGTVSDIRIKNSGANYSVPEPNALEVNVTAVNFLLEVTGFDVNRDLVVGAVG
jgi:hypothetical protein